MTGAELVATADLGCRAESKTTVVLNKYVEFDLTDYISEQLKEGNHTIAFAVSMSEDVEASLNGTHPACHGATFASKESGSGTAPYLTIMPTAVFPAAELNGIELIKGDEPGTAKVTGLLNAPYKYVILPEGSLERPKIGNDPTEYTYMLENGASLSAKTGEHLYIVMLDDNNKILGWTDIPITEDVLLQELSGDINGSGTVDIIDMIAMKKYFAGNYIIPDELIASADLDGNSEIDTVDMAVLRKILLGVI